MTKRTDISAPSNDADVYEGWGGIKALPGVIHIPCRNPDGTMDDDLFEFLEADLENTVGNSPE